MRGEVRREGAFANTAKNAFASIAMKSEAESCEPKTPHLHPQKHMNAPRLFKRATDCSSFPDKTEEEKKVLFKKVGSECLVGEGEIVWRERREQTRERACDWAPPECETCSNTRARTQPRHDRWLVEVKGRGCDERG